VAILTDDELRLAMTDLPGWTALGGAIHRQYGFRGFRAAIAFVNRMAEQATAAKHHPDIEIHYNRVAVSLSTHDEGGVTQRDVDLATAIERVSEPPAD
jgi:4a-hydroxytetrahydrobiopterin dehydratase